MYSIPKQYVGAIINTFKGAVSRDLELAYTMLDGLKNNKLKLFLADNLTIDSCNFTVLILTYHKYNTYMRYFS